MTPRESKNRKIGFSIAIAIHLLLLITWGAVMAWEAPGPPAEFPEVGILVAHGVDLEGMESENESDSHNENESESEEEIQENEDVETPEEIVSESEPVTDPQTDVIEPTNEPVLTPDPTSETSEPVSTQTNETVTSENTTENNSSSTNPKSAGPKTFQGTGTTEGVQGEEDGVKDVKTYDGNQGSGSLGQSIGTIPGFAWKKKPSMKSVPFDATVKIKVVVNNVGEIITVKFVECPYNDPAVRKRIEEELKRATLQATTQPDGNTVANITWSFKGK